MSDIPSVLTAAKLSKYAAALDTAGYDDLNFLLSRTEPQLRDIANMVKMPIGHADRFVFAISKAKKNASVTPPLPPSTSANTGSSVSAPASAAAPQPKAPATSASAAPSTTAAAPPKTKPRGTAECVAICIDRSGSMGGRFQEMAARGENAEKTLTHRSRMDAVKQIFYAFGDRTATLDDAHKLGLIAFDNRMEKMLDLTDQLDTFESIVDDLQPRGGTNIYNVIKEGCDMLKPVFVSDPNIDLRVLVLTDGESCGGMRAPAVLPYVNEIGAVVDAIIVGNSPDPNLRRIVTATGGKCYNIRTLSEGFQLMESESVVSLRERRGGTDKPAFVKRATPSSFNGIRMADMTLADGSVIQSMRDLNAAQRAAQNAQRAAQNAQRAAQAAAKQTSTRAKRVAKEMKKLVAGKDVSAGIHVFPDANQPTSCWRVLMEGPAGSPFEGGVFALRVDIPGNYPFSAPAIKFETPIYHCNVSMQGKICLEILYTGWGPAQNIYKCLDAIKNMLKNPDTDLVLRKDIATQMKANNTQYVDAAKALTAKEASLSVADWEKKWSVQSAASLTAGITKAGEVDKAAAVQAKAAAVQAKKVVTVPRPAPTVAVSAPVAPMKVASVESVLGKKAGGSSQNKRVLAELKKVKAGDMSVWMHEGKGIHIFPDADQFAKRWRVLMEGPAGSPFEGGVFALRVDIPGNYPFKGPSIRFETPIYHCNVSGAGKICLEILYSSWSPSLTLPKCIEAIQIMLKKPDTDNALRSWIAEETIAAKNSGGTETQYVDAAKKLTKEKASDSVDDWKKKWGIVQST